tara:strand:- start:1018 stop:1485 length:468 start_codon:yes stop_codon:yes gene_type:complete
MGKLKIEMPIGLGADALSKASKVSKFSYVSLATPRKGSTGEGIRDAIIAAMVKTGYRAHDIADELSIDRIAITKAGHRWRNLDRSIIQDAVYLAIMDLSKPAVENETSQDRPSVFASGQINLPVNPRCPSGQQMLQVLRQQQSRKAEILKLEYGE